LKSSGRYGRIGSITLLIMPPETSSIDYKKGEETLGTQASLAPSLSKMDSKFWEKGSKDS
jgi:hypothetical protein